MCGIFFSLSRRDHISPDAATSTALLSRGPDGSNDVQRVLQIRDTSLYLKFMSTVLSLRGKDIVTQPLCSQENKSVLCWNGEVWKVGGVPVVGNDTKRVFKDLLILTQEEKKGDRDQRCLSERIERYMAKIQGPYSFVFYDALSSLVFFGRDVIGRRSLVLQNDSNKLTLSSIPSADKSTPYFEVAPDGIYSIDLCQQSLHSHVGGFCFNVTKWGQLVHSRRPESQGKSFYPFGSINKDFKCPGNEEVSQDLSVVRCKILLLKSLHLRLMNIPKSSPREKEGGFHINVISYDRDERLGILFSGGLDCTILARLSHDLIPINEPIALLSVAFENPRVMRNMLEENNRTSKFCESCPDRITARKSLEELKRICPGRKWKFVAIDVPYEESKSHKAQVVSLMHPHATEMDLSIAMALYFAARGKGLIEESDAIQLYSTPARVLLSGLGADEIFGGYTRHENCYKRGGLESLIDELELDISRIGQRNLGRDDRVTAHWAKEIRYPYLDEEFLHWAMTLPIWKKCAFHVQDIARLEGIERSKYLLRRLAINLGLSQAAKEKKRAIQFGSRSAKMNDSKVRGSDGIHLPK